MTEIGQITMNTHSLLVLILKWQINLSLIFYSVRGSKSNQREPADAGSEQANYMLGYESQRYIFHKPAVLKDLLSVIIIVSLIWIKCWGYDAKSCSSVTC